MLNCAKTFFRASKNISECVLPIKKMCKKCAGSSSGNCKEYLLQKNPTQNYSCLLTAIAIKQLAFIKHLLCAKNCAKHFKQILSHLSSPFSDDDLGPQRGYINLSKVSELGRESSVVPTQLSLNSRPVPRQNTKAHTRLI